MEEAIIIKDRKEVLMVIGKKITMAVCILSQDLEPGMASLSSVVSKIIPNFNSVMFGISYEVVCI